MKYFVIFALAVAVTSALELSHANGQNAAEGQFPYEAFLSIKRDGLIFKECDGSLIGKNWILTSADCVKDADTIDIYLGSIVRYFAEVLVTANKDDVMVHESLSDDNIMANDIALIKIPDVKYSSRIQPVKLPSLSDHRFYLTGQVTISFGWGSPGKSFAEYLKWYRSEIISNEVCASTFGSLIGADDICVSAYDGASACTGNYGAPLILDNTNIQIGLLAARKCEEETFDFINLTNSLQWIADQTGIQN